MKLSFLINCDSKHNALTVMKFYFFKNLRMKNLFAVFILLLFFSCKESGVQIAKPSTFVHYYNGGFNDEAQDIIETSDKGFLILANSTVSGSTTRIKLIKVDAYGNQVWQKLFPDPKSGSSSNLSAYGLTAIPDLTGADSGYLLVGEEIYSDPNNPSTPAHSLLMIQVDPDGKEANSTTKTYDSVKIGIQVKGLAVSYSKTLNNFVVLGKHIQSPTPVDDMFVGSFDSNLNTLWNRTYGDDPTTLANRVFLSGDSIYWAGTRKAVSNDLMRWLKVQSNTPSVASPTYPAGVTSFNYTCNDVCRFGSGYGMVGSFGKINSKFTRIAFTGINEFGSLTDSATYLLPSAQVAEAGNSISRNYDGGFIILGTIAIDDAASDTNYYLIKIGKDGNKLWAKQYGGRFFDAGKKVIVASDGGYIVLGTTQLATVGSIFLMKTDSEGNIQ